DNTSPEVLELRPQADRLEELLAFLEGEADHVERSADLLLAYTSDTESLRSRVNETKIPVENTFYRPAGLEDVFLRLTGRSLVE
ncbi:MAG: ABC transporter ATP-binding protein, partial [Rubrobacter sp.]